MVSILTTQMAPIQNPVFMASLGANPLSGSLAAVDNFLNARRFVAAATDHCSYSYDEHLRDIDGVFQQVGMSGELEAAIPELSDDYDGDRVRLHDPTDEQLAKMRNDLVDRVGAGLTARLGELAGRMKDRVAGIPLGRPDAHRSGMSPIDYLIGDGFRASTLRSLVDKGVLDDSVARGFVEEAKGQLKDIISAATELRAGMNADVFDYIASSLSLAGIFAVALGEPGVAVVGLFFGGALVLARFFEGRYERNLGLPTLRAGPVEELLLAHNLLRQEYCGYDHGNVFRARGSSPSPA